MDFDERINCKTVNKTQNIMCDLICVNILLQLENAVTFKHHRLYFLTI